MSWPLATAAAIALLFHCAEVQAQKPLGILLAAGDIAKCGPKKKQALAVADVIAKQVLEADKDQIPVHVLALGDLAYDHGSSKDFNCFDESWGALLKLKLKNSDVKRLMLPVPGNHEYEQTGGLPYYGYFEKAKNPWVFQQETNQMKQPANNKGYYGLKFPDQNVGPWQLFGLNSELRGDMMAVQMNWLKQQLEATTPGLTPPKPPCVLAFWHKPLFSSGTHGHGDCYKVEGKPCELTDAPLCRPDEDAPYCKAMKTMKPAFELLHSQGASVVLTGHDHHFEQFKRLNANAKFDQDEGIRSFVVGTGGGSLYQKKRTYRWEDAVRDVYSHSSFGVLRIDLYADRYRWRFLPSKDNLEISLKVGEVVIDNDVCVARP
jgi:hypothetical protein